MKYLKKYEKAKKDIPDFEEGEYVICIDTEYSCLTEGASYLVKKIFKNKDNRYVCKINGKTIGENLGTFSCDRFISEIKHNMKKYNLL